MAELKTKQNSKSVEGFLGTVEKDKRRADAQIVLDMIKRITGWEPVMWGKSIIGFGAYTYDNASGRGGRWMMVGLSPRKTSLTIYIMPGFEPFGALMEKLGKYKTGKSCLYINKLEDIDQDVLEELIAQSIDVMKSRYEWAAK